MKLFIEKLPNTKHLLECTPRLYTCERWGGSFRIRSKGIQNYHPVKREVEACGTLFDREQEVDDESHWVSNYMPTNLHNWNCKHKKINTF